MDMEPGQELEFVIPSPNRGSGCCGPGSARGQLTGGNCPGDRGFRRDLLSAGHPGQDSLFLEDVEESIPRLDMYITHLENAGMMDGVAGIVLGEF